MGKSKCNMNVSSVLSSIIYSLTYLLVYPYMALWLSDSPECVCGIRTLLVASLFLRFERLCRVMLQHDRRVISSDFCLSFSCGLCSTIML